MDSGLEQLIRAIHASPYKAVVYVTGGCAQVSFPTGFWLCAPDSQQAVPIERQGG